MYILRKKMTSGNSTMGQKRIEIMIVSTMGKAITVHFDIYFKDLNAEKGIRYGLDNC